MAESTITITDSSPTPPSWNLYVDSSSTKDGSGAGLITENPRGEWHEHALKLMFQASNNEAEYEALIAGVELCCITGANLVRAFSNTQLVVSQHNGEYEVKDDTMVAYIRWV